MLGHTWDKWFYVAMCGLAGPALLVNGLLKAYWGRARPRDLEMFGGELEFTHFWQWTDQCSSNCSFTSGEVAAIAAILFSIALLYNRATRLVLLIVGVLAASFVGWIRVVMGGHFTSDSVMSTLLMLILVCEVYYLIFLRPNEWLVKIKNGF